MVFFELVSALHGGLFGLFLLVEELLDFVVVGDEDLVSLLHEGGLDLFELVGVLAAQFVEFGAHAHDEVFDVAGLALEGLGVVLFFVEDVLFELRDELQLGVDDLLAGVLLLLKLPEQLLAVFLLLEVVPGEVDLDVLLVARQHLRLDFIVPLIPLSLLFNSPLVFLRVS